VLFKYSNPLNYKVFIYRRMPSSGMWRRVDLVRPDVSEESIASIFRVEKSASEEPAWAGGCRLQWAPSNLFAFYAVRVVSKESTQFVLPTISSSLICVLLVDFFLFIILPSCFSLFNSVFWRWNLSRYDLVLVRVLFADTALVVKRPLYIHIYST
jgi:hypothetical protein